MKATPKNAPRRQAARSKPDPVQDAAVCRRCGRTKAEHGRMSLSCPPTSGRPKGQRFELLTEF